MRHRRWPIGVAFTAALLVLVAVSALAGCGGTSSGSTEGPARQLAALRDFELVPGRTATLTIPIERPELKLIAELDGAPARSLRVVLERLPAVDDPSGEPSPVAFPVKGHLLTHYTLYTGQSTGQLTPGTYRLSLNGSGRLLLFGVAED